MNSSKFEKELDSLTPESIISYSSELIIRKNKLKEEILALKKYRVQVSEIAYIKVAGVNKDLAERFFQDFDAEKSFASRLEQSFDSMRRDVQKLEDGLKILRVEEDEAEKNLLMLRAKEEEFDSLTSGSGVDLTLSEEYLEYSSHIRDMRRGGDSASNLESHEVAEMDQWIAREQNRTDEKLRSVVDHKNLERQQIQEEVASFADSKVRRMTQSLEADALFLSRQLAHSRKKKNKFADDCYARAMESFLQDAEKNSSEVSGEFEKQRSRLLSSLFGDEESKSAKEIAWKSQLDGDMMEALRNDEKCRRVESEIDGLFALQLSQLEIMAIGSEGGYPADLMVEIAELAEKLSALYCQSNEIHLQQL